MKLIRVFAPLIVAFVMLAPSVAYAADANFFGPIIIPECRCDSVPNPDGGNPIKSAPNWGCVLSAVSNTINFGVSIGIIVFVLIVAYAGVLFMASPISAENRELGRSMLTNAVIGFVILLAAWLMVDFVMKTLYKDNSGFGPWKSILKGDEDKNDLCLKPTATPRGPTTTGDGVTGTPENGESGDEENQVQEGVVEANEVTHEYAVNYLQQYQIGVQSTGQCSNPNNSTCTSLQGIQGQTIRQVAELRGDCTAANNGQSCNVNVTGGMETGHDTHDGTRIDICLSSCPTSRVHDYIRSFPRANAEQRSRDGLPSGGTVYADPCGNTYYQEGDHWHITVNSYCSNLPRS